ncbi:MAG TPA: YciI family protein [Amycolatopsis sp.]|nr:YciI family protein [Amycolatopsis sp.]
MFILLPTYCAPLDEVDKVMGAHGDWLAKQYSAGRFLVAGPREPREGGVILAAGDDRAEMEKLVATDPFTLGGVATYQLLEMRPTGGVPGVLRALAEHGVAVDAPRTHGSDSD